MNRSTILSQRDNRYIVTKLNFIADVVGYDGKQKHSSVIHGIKTIKNLCFSDENIRKQIIELETKIENVCQ